MTERENDFKKFLNERLQRSKQLEQEKELIRRSLEAQGRDGIERYESEVNALEPEAKVKLVQVIVPWWEELQRSGMSTEIGRLLSLKRQTRVPLDEAREYFSPYRVIREFRQSEQRNEPPFGLDARLIWSYKQEGKHDLAQFCEQISVGHEHWKSVFVADWVKISNGLDLRLLTYPKDRPPYWQHSDRPSSIEYNIDLTQPDKLSGDIHPGSFIHFAQGIETGRIWNILKKALGKE